MRSANPLSRLVLAATLFVSAQVSAQLQYGDRWRALSPVPTGETLRSVVITPTAAVAAGDGTTVLTSPTASNGVAWTGRQVNSASYIGQYSYVAYAGTTLMMGSGTTLYRSTDNGTTWQTLTTDLPTFDNVYALNGASGEFLLVMESYGNPSTFEVAVSTNGTNWTALGELPAPGPGLIPFPRASTRNAAGRRVVVGSAWNSSYTESYNVTWSTTDGSSWDVDTFIDGSGLYDVVWTGAAFVAVGGDRAAYSADGMNWSESSGLEYAECVAFHGGLLVAPGYEKVATSSDGGQTWTLATDPAAPFAPKDIAHNGAVWIAVGQDGVIHTSPNGTNWTRRTPSGQLTRFLSVAHNGLTGGSSRYIAIGNDERAWVSTTGNNWTRVNTPSFPGAESVLWDGSQFVIVSEFFSTVTTDGSSWSSVGMFGPNNQEPDVMTKCVFANGKYVAIGYSYEDGTPRIYSGSSYDGFAQRTVPAGSDNLFSLTYTGSMWIVVGRSGTILTSTDGNTWTKRAVSANGRDFTAVASTGSVHVVSAQGWPGYYTSTNGSTWVFQSSSPGNLDVLAGVNGRIIALSSYNGLGYITTDGLNWSQVNTPSSANFNSMTFTGNELLAAGDNLAIISSDVIPEVNFAVAEQSEFESSGTANIALSLSAPAASALSLPVSLGTSTAILGTDYTALPTTVNFAVGEQTVFFQVSLLNDAALDGNKTIVLNLGAATGVRLGSPAQHTLTLLDDDSPPTVSFVSTSRTVAEHGSNVLVQAELSWPAPAPVTIQLARTGSALITDDFTAPASLSFATGERTKTAVIALVDDGTTEADETVTFTISSPTGATAGSLNQSFALTILDNDAGGSDGRRWALRRPTPTSDGIYGLAALGGTLIGVGDAGCTVTSTDGGVNWTRRETGIDRGITLTDIVASAGRVYATGDKGHILGSDDGLAWSVRRVPGATDDFYFGGIAGNGSRVVAVGDVYDNSTNRYKPLIYSSADGEQWTAEIVPFGDGSLYDVAWNGSVFVAVGFHATPQSFQTKILTSPDGRAWSNRSSGLSNVTLFDVNAAGTTFVAFDHSRNCYTSPDGITWTKRSVGTLGSIVSGAWDGSKFVGVGGAITTSTNFTNFTQTASPATLRLEEVIFASGQFIATGGTGGIYTSTDGVTWTRRSGGFESYADFNSVTWANNQFVAVGNTADGSEQTLIATSPDGGTWTRVNNKLNKNLRGVAWSGTQLVAVGMNGSVATSANGTTWALKKSGTNLNLQAVTWAQNQFVAVGGHLSDDWDATGTGGAVVLTSPDGSKWTRRAVPTNQPLTAITYIDGTFIAVGRATADGDMGGLTGVILTSTNGVQWTRRESNSATDLTGVAADGNSIIATAQNYTLHQSLDGGINWAQLPGTPSAPRDGAELRSIGWSGFAYHAGGDGGQTLYSVNGTDWSASRSEIGRSINGFAWNSQTLVAVGSSASVQTSGPGATLNPTPQLSFVTNLLGVDEQSGTANVVLMLSSPVTSKTTVKLTPNLANTTATLTGPQADLTLPTKPIVINPGETHKHIAIPLKNDNLVEGTEVVEFDLTDVTGGAVLVGTTTMIISINDNDALPQVSPSSPSMLVAAGTPLALTAGSMSFSPVKIQWKKNNVPVPAKVFGSQSNTLMLPSVTLADGGSYTLTATNASGTATTSPPIVVGVYEPQAFPVSYSGSAATGSYTAVQKASSNCILHWQKNGMDITTALPSGVTLNANRSSLKVTNLTANADTYSCRVELPGVTMAPHTLASTFNIFSTSTAVALDPITTLPPATVGSYYFQLVNVTTGTVDRWTASGLPRGLRMVNGAITGFPEAATTTPAKVTITGSNGISSSTIKPTIVVNPLPSTLLGTHAGLLPRVSGYNNIGGVITVIVTANGFATASINLGSEKVSIVGRVMSSGSNWMLSSTTSPGSPPVTIAGKRYTLLFIFDAMQNPSGGGFLSVQQSSLVNFAFSTRQTLTGGTVPNYAGRYHYALRLRNNGDVGVTTLPQGHGFGSATVTSTGAVAYVGKTADGQAISAASYVLENGSSPLFSPLYKGKGSLQALPIFTLGGVGNVDSTILDTTVATWSKLADPTPTSARNYPAGWSPIQLNLQGSRFSVPEANAVVMGLTYTPGLPNAYCKIATDVFDDEPVLNLAYIGVKPKGATDAPFPDQVTLRLSVKPATGLFTGTANLTSELPNYIVIPRAEAKIEAQAVRIIGASPEHAAYGFITLPALPDFRISPMPAASSTQIRSLPVTIEPLVP